MLVGLTFTEHDLIISGSKHKVSTLIARNDHSFLVKYDGIPFEIFLSNEKGGPSLATIDGLPFTIGKSIYTQRNYTLLLNEKEVQVSFSPTSDPEGVQPERFAPKSDGPVQPTRKGGGRVIALMPGRVIAVKVKPSARVKVGDPMFVILAMKMENTLVAPRAGIISEVYVQSGGSVNKGDLLALIE